MINKNIFKRLKKEMLPLHKETLEIFTSWLERRNIINKLLLSRDLFKIEYEEFIIFCFNSSKFITKNKEYYEKYKINYLIFNKYLLNDIKFSETQIEIINKIKLKSNKVLTKGDNNKK